MVGDSLSIFSYDNGFNKIQDSETLKYRFA